MLTAALYLLASCIANDMPGPSPRRMETVAELNKCISDRKAEASGCYAFTGQLLALLDYRMSLMDASGCIRIEYACTNKPPFCPGDILDIVASYRNTAGLSLVFKEARKVGWRKIPDPVEISGHDVVNMQFMNRFVRVKGVIAASIRDELDSRYNWTILRTPTGPVFFETPAERYPLERMRALIDSEASIEGLVVRYSTWRTRLGGRISPIGEPPIAITRPAPANIDDTPPLADATALHRQRVEGTVLAVSGGHFFIRTPDGGCIRIQPSAMPGGISVGQRVTVAGFAEHDPLLELKLEEALVRVDGQMQAEREKVFRITFDDLFKRENGATTVSRDFNNRVVRLSGRIVEGCAEPGCKTLSGGEHTVSIDMSAFPEDAFPWLVPGSHVDVTGLCIGEFRQSSKQILFPRFDGFTVIPRSQEDVVVVSMPPWWTAGRLMVVIGILLAGLVAILIWNRALRTMSERKGKELALEQTRHAKSEFKVEERTRLAVELHDSISQTLTGVALQIETALGLKGVSFGPAEKLLLTARQMLASCRQELRCCLWDLRTRTFEEHDLTEAIRRTVEPHTADASVTVRFNVAREMLSEATVHAILKITRELVVNAIRHGHAKNIHIAGEYRDGLVRFSVRDNGCGFDPDAAPGARQGHFGLQGIRERTIERHGDIQIVSAPGKGTKITVSLKESMA